MIDKKTTLRMAQEAGLTDEGEAILRHDNEALVDLEWLQSFAAVVAEHEREDIEDEYWSCLQADLENGVKCLNERAAADFRKNYPELSKFADWLRARGHQ